MPLAVKDHVRERLEKAGDLPSLPAIALSDMPRIIEEYGQERERENAKIRAHWKSVGRDPGTSADLIAEAHMRRERVADERFKRDFPRETQLSGLVDHAIRFTNRDAHLLLAAYKDLPPTANQTFAEFTADLWLNFKLMAGSNNLILGIQNRLANASTLTRADFVSAVFRRVTDSNQQSAKQ